MTGRMKPILNVLSAQDRLLYKTHSCGLCVATKRVYGRRATLGHNSELVFVSLLLEGMSPSPYERRRGWCPVLPLVPRKLLAGPRAHRRALAAGALASLQLDLKDAREDGERRAKRLLCRSLLSVRGEIDLEGASLPTPVQAARRRFSQDDAVSTVVAGVVGSVFALAGGAERTVEVGYEIGLCLARLMNLSDALDDYFADLKRGQANVLQRPGEPPAPSAVGEDLHTILDTLDGLVNDLPIQRNQQLLESLINVHARARVETTVEQFEEAARKHRSASPGARHITASLAGDVTPPDSATPCWTAESSVE